MKDILLRVKRFCALLTGITFFVSGLVKLMDPVGAGLVMKEYMDFLHVGFLSGVAKTSAAVLAFAETVIGTALSVGDTESVFPHKNSLAL